MKIIIEAEAKEIADLVLAVQGQREDESNASDCIVDVEEFLKKLSHAYETAHKVIAGENPKCKPIL